MRSHTDHTSLLDGWRRQAQRLPETYLINAVFGRLFGVR
jgi:hypothetical protein